MGDPDESFRELLEACPRPALTRFVAGLWRARGFSVRTAEGTVLAERPTGDTEVVAVDPPPDGEPPGPDPDTVVVPRAVPSAEGDAVGPAELRELLLYGVPRDVGRTLFEETFDRPFRTVTGPPAGLATTGRTDHPVDEGRDRFGIAGAEAVEEIDGGSRAAHGTDRHRDSGRPEAEVAPRDGSRAPGAVLAGWGRAEVVLAIGLLAVGAVVGVVATQAAVLAGPGAAVGPASPTSTSVGGTLPVVGRTDATPAGVNADTYPSPLVATGIADGTRLGVVHANRVSGQSYVMVVRYAEYRDGRPRGFRRETVRVVDPAVFRTTIVGSGDLLAPRTVVSPVERYANGSVVFSRRPTADGARYDSQLAVLNRGWGPQTNRAQRLVSGVATANRSAIAATFERRDTRFFWVRVEGDPISGGTEGRGALLVDEHGVVHELRYRYRLEEHPEVTAEVVLRYERFGDVTVDPPDWIGAACRATAGAEACDRRGTSTVHALQNRAKEF